MTKILLVRHSQSEANIGVLGSIIGGRSPSVRITEAGIEQARKLGEYFSFSGMRFSRVYTSTAIRTIQTARHCFEAMGGGDVEVTSLEGLSEYDAGDWEGKPRDIYKREEVQRRLGEDNWNFIPGDEKLGESQGQTAERMYRQVLEIAENVRDSTSNENVIIFSHECAIKYLLAQISGVSEDVEARKLVYKEKIDNSSITVLTYHSENGNLTIDSRNKTPHLIDSSF